MRLIFNKYMMLSQRSQKKKNLGLNAVIILLVIAIVVVVFIRRDENRPKVLSPLPGAASTTVQLASQDYLNENGTAVITDEGNGMSQVIISISGEPVSADEPAVIYTGSCNLLGGKAYPLNDVIQDVSTTTIGVSLSEMLGQQLPLALTIDESAQGATSTACGDIGEN